MDCNGLPVRSMTMPGQVVSMSVSDDHLYVVCNVESRWWQFWKPRFYKQLVTLTAADLDVLEPWA